MRIPSQRKVDSLTGKKEMIQAHEILKRIDVNEKWPQHWQQCINVMAFVVALGKTIRIH